MRTNLNGATLWASALLLFVFGAAGNAFASFPEPGVSYRITEKNTQKCLDVSGGSVNIAPVGVWNCGAQASQKWQLRLIEDGAYQITAQHSMMSLDVQGGGPFTNNGPTIQQYPFNYGWNQEWRLVEAGDDYYYIVARHSGKLLTIIDGVAKQWEQRADYNQKFRFTALTEIPVCTSTDVLISSFTGSGEFRTTHPNAPGPFPFSIRVNTKFSECRTVITISDFPPITRSFNNPLPNTLTITLADSGSGRFASSNGRIGIPATFAFTNTNVFLGNSRLPLTLAAQGSPDMLARTTGQATLRGTGTFVGGALNGFQGTVVVTGTFAPIP